MNRWRQVPATACLLLALAAGSVSFAQAPGAGNPGTTNPDWVHRPTPQDIQAAFPPRALAAGVKQGRVVVACMVDTEGNLRNCAIQAETPDGYGFGARAITLAQQFQMKTQTKDGRSLAGATLSLPITFVSPAAKP